MLPCFEKMLQKARSTGYVTLKTFQWTQSLQISGSLLWSTCLHGYYDLLSGHSDAVPHGNPALLSKCNPISLSVPHTAANTMNSHTGGWAKRHTNAHALRKHALWKHSDGDRETEASAKGKRKRTREQTWPSFQSLRTESRFWNVYLTVPALVFLYLSLFFFSFQNELSLQ